MPLPPLSASINRTWQSSLKMGPCAVFLILAAKALVSGLSPAVGEMR